MQPPAGGAMSPVRRLAAACLAAFAAAGPAPAQTSLTAELRLTDPATGAGISPEAGQPVRLEVRLTDAVSDQPPRGLDLVGWVRPVERGAASCSRAAQAFRATRRIPLGSSDLNGILVATLNRDASLGVIDPKLDLYSSNMIAAHRLDAMPADIAVDRQMMRALLTFPEAGRIDALSLVTGDVAPLATGLPAPAGIAAVSDGGIWVASRTDGRLRRLAPDGTLAATRAVGSGPVQLRKIPDAETDLVGAFTKAGGLLLVDGVSGREILRAEAGAELADVTFLSDQAALALLSGRAEAELRFADTPGTAHRFPTGIAFSRLASGPDSRIAIAYTPGAPTFALIDTAVGRVVQPVELSDATVSEVAFTDNAAFLISHDGGFVAAVDLATVALGREAVIRQVNLGARTELPPDGAELLTPMFPSPHILAVEPENQTGWVIGEIAASVEMPPMHSVRLRGGVPHTVRIVDRSFREHAPGHFETVWAFEAGEQELVLTTGIGELSTCLRFEVRGEPSRSALTPVAIRAEPVAGPLVAGVEQEIVIRLSDRSGQLLDPPSLRIRLPSLQSSWSGTATAQRDGSGGLRARVRLPHPGSFVVQPLDLPSGYALVSAAVIQAVAQGE